jgi:2-methylcitrate dehydratase
MFVKAGEEGRLKTGPTGDASPFELVLSRAGGDFAVMGMHFKLGLYEHQSAGAIQALIDLVAANPELLEDPRGEKIASIKIVAYEPAFGIIGDPAKRNPTTRQSADHSMVYIVATLLRKALERKAAGWDGEGAWKELMLEPADYSGEAIANPLTRRLMEKISFEHGGPEYDRRYPDGIPTSMVVRDSGGGVHDSGLVMYPAGHARNREADLESLLQHKFRLLGGLVGGGAGDLAARFGGLEGKSAEEVAGINDFELGVRGRFE